MNIAGCDPHLGELFKRLREESGMTQLELSKKLGYRSSQLVSNWERGLCSPPMDAIAAMLELFDFPPAKMVQFLVKASRDYFEKALLPRKSRTAKTGTR